MFMFGMTGMAHDATVEYNGRRRSEARTAKVSNNRQQNKSAPTQKQEREKNTRDDDDDDDDDPDSKDASSLRRRRLVVDARAAHVKQRLKDPSSHLVSGSFPLRRGTSDSSRRWTSAGGSKTEGRARRRVRTLARPSRLCARALLARPRTPELSLLLLLKVLLLLRSRTSTTTTTTTTMPRAIHS